MRMTGVKAHDTLKFFSVFAKKNVFIFAKYLGHFPKNFRKNKKD
jgi:hypothetical protein